MFNIIFFISSIGFDKIKIKKKNIDINKHIKKTFWDSSSKWLFKLKYLKMKLKFKKI